eukprot:IDg19781t1
MFLSHRSAHMRTPSPHHFFDQRATQGTVRPARHAPRHRSVDIWMIDLFTHEINGLHVHWGSFQIESRLPIASRSDFYLVFWRRCRLVACVWVL